MHLFKVDVDDDTTDDFTDAAGVTKLPTFLLYDGEGAVVGRWSGYEDAEAFLALKEGFSAEPMTLEARAARYAESPTKDDALLLWTASASADEWTDALAYLVKADELREEGSADLAYEIFETHFSAAMDDQAELEPTLAAADAALASAETTEAEHLQVAQYLGHLDDKFENASFASTYRDRALQRTSGNSDPEIARARYRLLVDKALEEGNKPAAAQYKRATFEAGWEEDPKKLNAFAWWSFENDVGLEAAEALAARGVKLSEPGSGRAMILDTQAEIAFKLGRAEDAVALIERAIKEDPEGDLYKQQLAKFRGETAGEGE